MATEPSLVLEELLSRIGGDREFAVELLNEFVDSLTREIAALNLSLEKKDAEGIRYRAHSLKGSALNLAAREFARLASLCENAARNGQFEEIETTLPLLSYEAETLQSIVLSLG